ncbi:hypothetical protein UFOVP410_58 [uncultured Caudovirales phage]|uniref:Uncharacterized protein n=1 Tax=uncultured Caudovirales phage TaxID=2100421 RepID=A0A6J5MBX4_9CAUD|nr:hypothetical protein UFOVP410_58 [uncultured Caudovirales phage]
MSSIKDKYRIVFDPNDSKKWCVELLQSCDPFHGIIYSYGKFSVTTPENENEIPKLSFETDIVYVPDRLKNYIFPDEKEIEMQKLLASILIDIIDDNLDKTKSENGKLYLELA